MVKLSRLFFILILLPLIAVAFGPKSHAEPRLQEVRTCFDGYTLYSDGTCIQEINEAPIPSCPTIYSTGESGRQGCRVEVPYILRCPDGFTPGSEGECLRPSLTDVTYFCPVGFEDAGIECIKIIPSETVATCEEGELIGESCVILETVNPIITIICPDNTIGEDNTCWQTSERFDCTGQYLFEQPCDDPICARENAKEKAKFRQLKPKERKWSPEQDVLSRNENLVAVSAPHTSKVLLVQQICERRIEVQPFIQRNCPTTDFIEDSGSCIREILRKPILRCVSTGNLSNCPPTVHRTPKLAKCSTGIVMKDNKCETLVSDSPLIYCPNDFVDNGKACEGIIPAPLECPEQLELVNGRCVGKRVREALIFRLAEDFEAAQVEPRISVHSKKRGKEEKKTSNEDRKKA